MQEQIKRGRTLSLLLFGAVSVIFLINVFYPLYLSGPDQSNRIMVLLMMLTVVALAYKGVPSMRIIIGGVLLVLALFDGLVLVAALAAGRIGLSIGIGSLILLFLLIGWLLLTSKSVKAFEAARKQKAA